MKLYNLLKPELIRTDCQKTTTNELLEEIVHHLKVNDVISNESLILKKLLERESLGTTSIGNNAAVPHAKLKELKDPIIFIGISKAGLLYHENDKKPVHLIILILSPNYSPIIHLQILAAAASLIKKSDRLIKECLTVDTPRELIDVVRRFETADD
ncbi:MAG: PTS sugar transporter subunit IIA [bacterium]|nr:PTS sugar transporter subunit IIA [bacterium]